MKRTFQIYFNTAIVGILASLCFSTVVNAQINFDFAQGMIQDVVDNPWDGSFAAGLNGKSGNSNNLDINMTLNLNRDTDFAKTALLASYFYSSNDIATTTDRFFGQARRDRKLNNPRWSWFNQVQLETDRFKAYDYRIALHTGIGYEVYKNDNGFLNLRVGAGASREVGGANDDWIPELQLGGDWERQVTENLKLFATADYYPSFEDFADYRLVTNTGLEFVVDAERNINFRMFALNRYDSTPPAGNKRNDIDYGMAVVLGF
jgi:putative salt-induced outer membrane protein YdiY